MRLVPIIVAALLIAIQFPLWLGKGGWMRVHEAEQQLAAQNRTNADLVARNAKLAAEVNDLKEGAGAVEERARYELGMLKEGELFVQIVDAPKAAAASDDRPVMNRKIVP
ncbi:MAG: cell division protein FtsB [Burkholderiaceae bacterium]